MIEIYEKFTHPGSVAEGRYLLLRGDAPYETFVSPCLSLEMLEDAAIMFRARRLIAEYGEVARFDGRVGDEVMVARRSVSAVCDTIAEVNALIESSMTADALFRNALEGISSMHGDLQGQSFPDENPDEIEEIRAFTLLNNSGDSTITWEKENDEVMRALIEKKMKEGVAFFVIPPKVMGFIPRPKSRIGDVDEIMKRRSVSVKDEDFAGIIAGGLAKITERPDIDTERAEQCHDPAVIARSQSIGVMPMRGG
ncbi:hypothetical protein GOB57_24940 [Sinorhizobium meliloti]|nr:hypothetical protein [Sinorhizobium meliloti]